LLEPIRGEGLAVVYTMRDFQRDYIKEHLPQLTPEERADVLRSLPVEVVLAGIPLGEIRRYLDRVTAGPKAPSRRPRRKK
jgi:hypothetical protein